MSAMLLSLVSRYAPMPLSTRVAELALLAVLEGFAVWSLTMVEVDDERLKVLARGARWVSLSSAVC